ncbi:uncharacterized protein K452DRAFT_105270 [Aplosporella prunicola CBS 121167]|uniref:Uncharacterized protein n=1 Tax=Aplosporella prunicola CBS 121167 TaxID=1176127 RepID=A0A6A6BT99_9PEZI|nr:uncharacterized protein K452DRAFT_105270 [Aplosporella prunicola CBS 121167]KAF2146057.1 hypothetical protein K452DRAFT_105270 [Aplosporella prunicola CBS 121167]
MCGFHSYSICTWQPFAPARANEDTTVKSEVDVNDWLATLFHLLLGCMACTHHWRIFIVQLGNPRIPFTLLRMYTRNTHTHNPFSSHNTTTIIIIYIPTSKKPPQTLPLPSASTPSPRRLPPQPNPTLPSHPTAVPRNPRAPFPAILLLYLLVLVPPTAHHSRPRARSALGPACPLPLHHYPAPSAQPARLRALFFLSLSLYSTIYFGLSAQALTLHGLLWRRLARARVVEGGGVWRLASGVWGLGLALGLGLGLDGLGCVQSTLCVVGCWAGLILLGRGGRGDGIGCEDGDGETEGAGVVVVGGSGARACVRACSQPGVAGGKV